MRIHVYVWVQLDLHNVRPPHHTHTAFRSRQQGGCVPCDSTYELDLMCNVPTKAHEAHAVASCTRMLKSGLSICLQQQSQLGIEQSASCLLLGFLSIHLLYSCQYAVILLLSFKSIICTSGQLHTISFWELKAHMYFKFGVYVWCAGFWRRSHRRRCSCDW